ncbi:unnamed protein product [Amoebophrya sp. A120]|nr:unnamed protein product [Amoebophrya sp. A120]|eukprot:GSA120T00020256001.1
MAVVLAVNVPMGAPSANGVEPLKKKHKLQISDPDTGVYAAVEKLIRTRKQQGSASWPEWLPQTDEELREKGILQGFQSKRIFNREDTNGIPETTMQMLIDDGKDLETKLASNGMRIVSINLLYPITDAERADYTRSQILGASQLVPPSDLSFLGGQGSAVASESGVGLATGDGMALGSSGFRTALQVPEEPESKDDDDDAGGIKDSSPRRLSSGSPPAPQDASLVEDAPSGVDISHVLAPERADEVATAHDENDVSMKDAVEQENDNERSDNVENKNDLLDEVSREDEAAPEKVDVVELANASKDLVEDSNEAGQSIARDECEDGAESAQQDNRRRSREGSDVDAEMPERTVEDEEHRGASILNCSEAADPRSVLDTEVKLNSEPAANDDVLGKRSTPTPLLPASASVVEKTQNVPGILKTQLVPQGAAHENAGAAAPPGSLLAHDNVADDDIDEGDEDFNNDSVLDKVPTPLQRHSQQSVGDIAGEKTSSVFGKPTTTALLPETERDAAEEKAGAEVEMNMQKSNNKSLSAHHQTGGSGGKVANEVIDLASDGSDVEMLDANENNHAKAKQEAESSFLNQSLIPEALLEDAERANQKRKKKPSSNTGTKQASSSTAVGTVLLDVKNKNVTSASSFAGVLLQQKGGSSSSSSSAVRLVQQQPKAKASRKRGGASSRQNNNLLLNDLDLEDEVFGEDEELFDDEEEVLDDSKNKKKAGGAGAFSSKAAAAKPAAKQRGRPRKKQKNVLSPEMAAPLEDEEELFDDEMVVEMDAAPESNDLPGQKANKAPPRKYLCPVDKCKDSHATKVGYTSQLGLWKHVTDMHPKLSDEKTLKSGACEWVKSVDVTKGPAKDCRVRVCLVRDEKKKGEYKTNWYIRLKDREVLRNWRSHIKSAVEDSDTNLKAQLEGEVKLKLEKEAKIKKQELEAQYLEVLERETIEQRQKEARDRIREDVGEASAARSARFAALPRRTAAQLAEDFLHFSGTAGNASVLRKLAPKVAEAEISGAMLLDWGREKRNLLDVEVINKMLLKTPQERDAVLVEFLNVPEASLVAEDDTEANLIKRLRGDKKPLALHGGAMNSLARDHSAVLVCMVENRNVKSIKGLGRCIEKKDARNEVEPALVAGRGGDPVANKLATYLLMADPSIPGESATVAGNITKSISRKHFLIYFAKDPDGEDGRWWLQDHSASGTAVNGVRIKQTADNGKRYSHKLADGDLIGIGSEENLYRTNKHLLFKFRIL